MVLDDYRQMARSFLLLPLFVLASVACGSDGTSKSAPDAAINAVDAAIDVVDAAPTRPFRYFQHPLYDDPADCPDDPKYNCSADLELCDDGRAFALVTDIANAGDYTESDTTITASFGSGDVPQVVVFSIQADGSLIDDWLGWTWVPSANEFPYCE